MIPKHPIDVQVFTPTATRDAHGNAVPGYLPAVTRYVYAVAPKENEELIPGRDENVEALMVYAPTGFEIGYRDRVVWREKIYDVRSTPADYNFGPFDFMPGVVFVIERREG